MGQLESCSRNLSYLAKSWSPSDSCLKSLGKGPEKWGQSFKMLFMKNLKMHVFLWRKDLFLYVRCSPLGVLNYTVRLSWTNVLFERGGSCDTWGEKALSLQMSFIVHLDLMASCCSSHKLHYFSLKVFTVQTFLH